MDEAKVDRHINKNDFAKIENRDVKLDIIFDYVRANYTQMTSQIEVCGVRFIKIEKTLATKKWWDKVTSFAGGVVGGIIAMVTYLKLFVKGISP